jgi:ADP-ribosylglycohydrolase
MASVFARLRVATPVERLQIKWFAYAAPIPLLGEIVEQVIYAFSDTQTTGDATVGSYIAVLGIAILPIAVGIAILRHNLYDIDRLINRTLVYSSLTLLLGLGFIASVILLQVVISPFTTGNDLAIAGSTLLIAAIFRPVRGRIQDTVDRRFFRPRYDASRTLAAFSAAVRDNVDVEDLATQVERVIDETIKPRHFSIWLRQPETRSR